MARCRIARPETQILPLSDGDHLVVKRRLSAGDRLDALGRMYRETETGRVFDPVQAGIATILAYLVDWTLTTETGAILAIANKSPGDVESILRGLYFEDYAEIRDAINAHDDAMSAERAAEKKTLPTAPASAPISRSLVAVGGATSG